MATNGEDWTLAADDLPDEAGDSRVDELALSRFLDTPRTAARPLARALPAAGPGARLLAWLLDALFVLALSAPLLWWTYGEAVTRLDDTRPLSLALNWLLPAALAILFWTWQGATPGKLFAGIRVIDAVSGRPPTLPQSLMRWAGYLLSALSLGLGFAWALIDSEKQGLHDKLARTRVVRRRAVPAVDKPGYIGAHWRGEQSLVQSFWVNNLLLSLPLGMAITALMSWISLKGEALQAGSIAVLVGWPLLLLVDTWCIVGAWRAASAYKRSEGSPLWGTLAQLVLALGALQIGISGLFGFLPQSGQYLQLASGVDPIGQASFRLSADGRTLRLRGPIGMGDATRLHQLLDEAREVRLFELESPGGRLYEAERMVGLVRKSAAATRAVGGCESACTLVFLAGSQRQLMPGARLGFHRASSGTYNALADEAANRQLASTYRDMGLPESFIQHTARTPAHSMWYPPSEELIAHSLVVAPPRTLDVALPEQAALASRADFADALRANPAWYQLDARFPDLIDGAAARMHERRQAGTATLQAAAQQALAQRMPELVLGSPPELRHRYVGLLTAQLRSARAISPARCQALLAGLPQERQPLGAELAARESAWVIDAALTTPARRLPASASTVELEVLRRTVGESAVGLLSGVWSSTAPQPSAAHDCSRALQILERMAELPPAQRELAERLVFQPHPGRG